MGDEESDGVPYDDDFEEEIASDVDLNLSRSAIGESLAASAAGGSEARLLQSAPSATAAAGLQPKLGRRSRPAESSPADDKAVFGVPDTLDLVRGGSASSTGAGQRVVRGKVSVGDAGDRPTSGGDLGSTSVTMQAQATNGKPSWLQFNNSAPRHDTALNSRPTSGRGRPSRTSGRPPLDPDPVMAMLEVSRGGGRGSASLAGRSASRDVSAVGDAVNDGRERGSGGGDRQVKRLEQEILRLRQRLSESDLFSSQDDMLPKFVLEEVEIGCQIAQGGFSSVHHAVWRSTPCALKKIFDPVLTQELKDEFESEVKMLRLLRHPHVITLMAVCRVPPALSVLTEFVGGGSVFELLHGPPSQRRPHSIGTEPGAVFPCIVQAAGALAYMHSMQVVHRDIKSHNVLLTEGSRPIAKLCDFGLARLRSELCTGSMQWAGTPAYMAPELFTKKKYGEGVDVFAFGALIWEVASTEIPHANMDPADIAHRVLKQDGACLPVTHSWPKSLKAMLKQTLAVDPEGRPTMVQVTRQLHKVIMDFPLPD